MNLTLFTHFFQINQPKDMEQCIELYAIFGGFDTPIDTDAPLDELLQQHILNRVEEHRKSIFGPLGENPLYPKLLRAISIGDRRGASALRRAHIGKEKGSEAFNFLRETGILSIEHSRETPLIRLHPKQKFKKAIERHRISHKYRFSSPFIRFWFAFVEPFKESILAEKYEPFYHNFHQHFNAFVGFIFEELCDRYIQTVLSPKFDDTIIESGSYWDREIEIDLLCDTRKGEIWIGECKWTNHKCNKKELRHLEEKWLKLSLHPDKIFLFSKRGFSNELRDLKEPKLYLLCADDFETLARQP